MPKYNIGDLVQINYDEETYGTVVSYTDVYGRLQYNVRVGYHDYLYYQSELSKAEHNRKYAWTYQCSCVRCLFFRIEQRERERRLFPREASNDRRD